MIFILPDCQTEAECWLKEFYPNPLIKYCNSQSSWTILKSRNSRRMSYWSLISHPLWKKLDILGASRHRSWCACSRMHNTQSVVPLILGFSHLHKTDYKIPVRLMEDAEYPLSSLYFCGNNSVTKILRVGLPDQVIWDAIHLGTFREVLRLLVC